MDTCEPTFNRSGWYCLSLLAVGLKLAQHYNRLPNRPELPAKLAKLRQAVENSPRQIEDTVLAVKKHLDTLQDGIQELGILLMDLTDEAVAAVSRVLAVRDRQMAQLKQTEQTAEIAAAITAVEEQLGLERP